MHAALRLGFLGMLMMASASVLTAATENDFRYITLNGTIIITGGCRSTPGTLIIPDRIRGLPVTGIGGQAFSGCGSLTNVIIPTSVTGIEDSAFSGCTNLVDVDIPNSVTSIGFSAFNGCTNLPHITIPDSVVFIGDGAFWGCWRLTRVTIGSSVSRIGVYAFGRCTSLTHVTIPSSVTSIGDYAFRDCTNLTSITIDKSVTCIEEGVFSGCTSLASITIPNSVISIRERAFAGSSLTSVTNDMTTIGSGFAGMKHLTNFVMGNHVRAIGPAAFDGCSSLTSITIPEGVTNIGQGAFRDCASLTIISIPDSVTSIDAGAFEGCPLGVQALFNPSRTRLAWVSRHLTGNFVIPDTVTSIGNSAFWGCSGLTRIGIPNSVTNIAEEQSWAGTLGMTVFHACSSLTEIAVDALNPVYSSLDGVLFNKDQTRLLCCPAGKAGAYTIPDSVTDIAAEAFFGCGSLTSVTIGNSVTRIGRSTFVGCTSLTNLTVGRNMSEIYAEAPYPYFGVSDYPVFEGCPDLTEMYFSGNAPSLNPSFARNGKATVYYLPGTAGWGPAFGGRPTEPWIRPEPTILSFDERFGASPVGFGFRISWATNVSVVVEASTSVAHPTWTPLSTNTFTDGWTDFSDPEWVNRPARFYRLRSP